MSPSGGATFGSATAADLALLPEDIRFHEILGGHLVRKAPPAAEHGAAQAALAALLFGPFNRHPGVDAPGGWWIMTEVEVELEPHEVYRPDLIGYRRTGLAERPKGSPLRQRPDWVCEILSPGNPRVDTVRKMRVYHRCRIPSYWIVDPRDETLTIYRRSEPGYLAILIAERGERVRAEPFDAVELSVGTLVGEDP